MEPKYYILKDLEQKIKERMTTHPEDTRACTNVLLLMEEWKKRNGTDK